MTDKVHDVLNKLLEETTARRVRWEDTGRESSFRVNLPNGLIRIDEQQGSNNFESVYIINIYNAKNRLIETIDDNDTDDPLLRDLFRAARSTALNVEETLDGLMQDIMKGKTLPTPPSNSGPSEDDIPF